MIERCMDEIEQLRADYALNDIYEKLSKRESWQITFSTFRGHYYKIRSNKQTLKSSVENSATNSVKRKSALFSPQSEQDRELSQARVQALFDQNRKD